jgi:hypothetical protein
MKRLRTICCESAKNCGLIVQFAHFIDKIAVAHQGKFPGLQWLCTSRLDHPALFTGTRLTQIPGDDNPPKKI